MHLSVAKLLAFADAGADTKERALYVTHLQSCSLCCEKLSSLQSFKFGLNKTAGNFKEHNLTGACIPTEVMGDFMGSRLPSDEKTRYSRHVAECEMCFERAAYFSWSSAKMTEGILEMSDTAKRYKKAAHDIVTKPSAFTAKKPSIIDSIKGWISSPAPAYAFAVVLLLFMVSGPWGDKAKLNDLGSDNTFSIYKKPAHSGPSFGFADAGRKVSETPASLSVENTGEGFLFTWADVKNATGYTFKLFEITSAGPVEVYSGETNETGTTPPAGTILPDKAYRWKVTGETDEGEIFMAAGQFTLVE